MSVEFVNELPERKTKNTHWVEESAQLRENPGQWAIIDTALTPERSAATARNISAGILKAFRPPGTFEAASRTIDGEHRVYARYVGEQ